MVILQQPDILSLSGNIKEFRISSTDPVSFTLSQGGVEVLAQSYTPGKDGIITINLRDIVHSRLSFNLQESAIVYEQTTLASDFVADISGTRVTFRAIRSGVDRLADTATNFLTQNFLTWQPSLKAVTYYSPEFLTYYAVVPCVAKLRAYYTDISRSEPSQQDITLADLTAGKAYTIPLQYASVAAKLGNKLPAYYDVFVESASGDRLTYIQRYYASDMLSEQEQWILFENSLGGIDTFRAYGSTEFSADHTHNIAEIDEVSTEYRVDTERKFQKNTGHLTKKERTWLLDFFPSHTKYIYAGTYLRPIVVLNSNVTYTDRELPSNYTFTYKYADSRPLLNLPRTDVPSEVLDITVPSVGSFTVPPRLVEFPRLPLTEGALFPIQQPYSEEWSTTTTGSLSDFIAERLSENYGGSGGIGHHHNNIDLLQLLSYAAEYLLVSGKKIKAGYADKAGSVDGLENYMRRDRPEQTEHLLKLLGGLAFNDGYGIDQYGEAFLRILHLTGFLEVPEIRYNRIEISTGDKWNAPGGGIIESVDTENQIITLKLEKGEIGSVSLDDISMSVYHSSTDSENASETLDDGRGNRLITGFATSYFRITEILDKENHRFRYALRGVSDRWKYSIHPMPMSHFVCYGNFSNKERQTSNYSTRSYTRYLRDVSDWEFSAYNVAAQFGDLSNLKAFGIDVSGHSIYLDNIYMTGKIDQSAYLPDRMEFEVSNGTSLSVGEHTDVTPYLYNAWDDVTDKYTRFIWTRDSGATAEDAAWNIAHKESARTLTISFADLNTRSVVFTCTASKPGAKPVLGNVIL